MDWILEQAELCKGELIANRRHIHRNPELGYREYQTSAFIAGKLQEYGLEVHRGFGELETGVMGVLRGGGKRTIVLRADIDALPVEEQSGLEYRSAVPQVMHACGHDAHAAMLLGAAKILAQNKSKVSGTVKFIFQPAEEGPYPGGASYVVKSGVLADADAAFALHVSPDLPVGSVNLHRGAGTASADMFRIVVTGRGGHGSEPAKAIDPIVMASQAVLACQTIISRSIDARDASVLSICTINGGSVGNVIPGEVILTGTLRNFNREVRDAVVARMEKVLEGVARMYGGDCSIAIEPGYPALMNDAAMVESARAVCGQLFDAENIHVLDRPIMGGEDFAYFAQILPSTMLWLGVGNASEGIDKPLHNPGFLLDERALAKGAALHAAIAVDFLNQQP